MEALQILKDRFGNAQLMIASHMSKLMKLEKVKFSRNIKELRHLIDQIESHVRSLSTVGVKSDHFGPMLIPMVLERLPDDVKLEVSRKLGKQNWKIEEFMQVLKGEIAARESCFLMKSQETNEGTGLGGRNLTTGALFTRTKVLVCAFCSKNHFLDKCTAVTDVSERRKVVRSERLCYKCLLKEHAARNCRSKRVCFICKSSNHHTAICTKNEVVEENQNEGINNQTVNVANSSTSVLLQMAKGVVSDNSERCCVAVNILFDLGSQRTYISDKIVSQLHLKPQTSKSVIVNTFGDERGKLTVMNEYAFCVKNEKRGCNLY